MARILVTSGPTRQYIDPVRFMTNSSSGRMGAALAAAVLELGHEVVIVSGPVEIEYPEEARVVPVVSTEEMLQMAKEEFVECDGLIGAAAPCDYRPRRIESSKIAKTGKPLKIELVETADVVASLAAEKGDRWVVGFALETEDHRFRAIGKMQRKSCDLMVSNGVQAMRAHESSVEVLDSSGNVLLEYSGPKTEVGRRILSVVQQQLIEVRAV